MNFTHNLLLQLGSETAFEHAQRDIFPAFLNRRLFHFTNYSWSHLKSTLPLDRKFLWINYKPQAFLVHRINCTVLPIFPVYFDISKLNGSFLYWRTIKVYLLSILFLTTYSFCCFVCKDVKIAALYHTKMSMPPSILSYNSSMWYLWEHHQLDILHHNYYWNVLSLILVAIAITNVNQW